MIILGLTGSIGMGKSTAANMFRYLGVPVYDADAAVHDILGPGGKAVDAVGAEFPGVVSDNAVDRGRLGEAVFDDPAALKRLEGILHPMVRRRQSNFLKSQSAAGARVVVMDIPLLFETGGERNCDAVAVVSAPAFLQRIRVLSRPGMTVQKFDSILARQMPDAEKRQRADFIISSGLGRAYALRQITNIVTVTKTMVPRRWPPFGLKNRV